MHRIFHCFEIKASRDKVHRALTTKEGLTGWWTTDVEGGEAIGSVYTFRFTSGAFNKMSVQTLEPDRIGWECTDGHTEWIETHVLFALRQERDRIKVLFSHSGWRELTEYVGECSFQWAYYMTSLQRYCETGQGTPNRR